MLSDKGPWSRTDPVIGRGGAVNVTDLEPGKKYTFRVVGVNGIGDTLRETRSNSHTVQVGPDNGKYMLIASGHRTHMRALSSSSFYKAYRTVTARYVT
jgi:hypothetical protein